MTEIRRFAALDLLLLVIVIAGAGAARVAYLNASGGVSGSDTIFAVQDDRKAELNTLVTGLKDGHGMVAKAPLATQEEPTAHVTIGFPWLISRIDGYWVNRSTDELVRYGQCVLGALTAGLYFLLARRAFNSLLVGTLTGVLCAVYPFWVFNTAEMNDGVLVTFVLGLSLFLGVRGGQDGGALTSLLFGLSLAGLACLRAVMLPFAVVAVLWYLHRCRTLQRGWLYAILAFLGFVNGLIPITAYNYQTFRTVMPVADSAYWHLWVGNNPHATGGPISSEELEKALDPSRLSELQQQRQPERYQQLAHDILDEVKNNPSDTFQRRIRAGLGFFLSTSWLEGRPVVRDTGISRESLPTWLNDSLTTVLPGTLFVLLFFGVLGWRWSYGWRRSAMPTSLAVMWIPLPYIVAHAEMYHGPRLPLDGVLIAYVSLAVVCLIPGLGARLLQGEEFERSY